ncbi:MAG: ATP-binding cassette domain-containing protein [Ilumatobacter sp.]|nr:ATP-binding cassette domain-containing protein [Ilumatobacter sp.]
MTNPAHLWLEDVTKSYGARRVLGGVTMLAQGGITAILGPNGAGKSTLLRCAATVLEPDSGSVAIDGLDPRHEHERIEARRRLGYAPQEAGFDPRIQVATALDYIAVLKHVGDDRRRRRSVFEVLDRLGLADRAGERVGDLSGGMRRRLLVAQALLGTPTLLVLDEPGAGLDPDERLRLREVLAERRRTTTVVLATHLTDEAATADAVVVLADATVRFAGSPAQLAAHADGRVWIQSGFPPPGIRASWQLPDGRHRCLGHPPEGAAIVEPTLEEGYLLVRELTLA